MVTVVFESPLGLVRVSGDEKGVAVISCTDSSVQEITPEIQSISPLVEPVQAAVQQLKDYFAGSRQTFDFPLNPSGTTFQQTVWQALLDVPFGTTQSYLALSRRIGDEKAIRAVAAANGRNPLWIVVPCHRIIGSDGSLTGYAGGLWRKQWLLEHEGAFAKSSQLSLF
ncbi:methylated-DNA--[protein]-cysteine S-methyltransferase [Spirosoma sp. KCTC 42546]|uniref:methylated-DNA--[protein]-cysteine S-methyltransferase n=1 Tax=Spirosoma sp. KCTC 42546 TaxID=2520506 RepID=UPI0011572E09|nr:methylated-DNA--[protein]-cysteine S-methyltransferase [Spirosoma sp. KCTC 42546]QDK79394.1 methylated-DNA--[protein]-cysteine S-methyltransferase [Spirosoma sp. KCTC 42546]